MAAKTLKDDLGDFETSEEVDVTPTFDSLGLREDLLRGVYAYGTNSLLLCLPPLLHRCFRFREAFRHSTARHQANRKGPRCHCPVRSSVAILTFDQDVI